MAEEGRAKHSSVFLSDATTPPLPGSEKHPQGRLFAPVGMNRGDPWKLHPENWMGQSETPAHSDVVSWHASESSQLPRYDSPEQRQIDPYDDEWSEYDDEGEPTRDYSEDSRGRPMATYGSAIGMHFGDPGAAISRDSSREFIHPVRIPKDTLTPPPKGSFATELRGGGIASGPHQSSSNIYNSETGESTRDTRWSDSAANYAEKGTDLVERGKTLEYRNDVERPGSTSYRTLPESTRTWSEDVMGTIPVDNGYKRLSTIREQQDSEHGIRNTPHPALLHLAKLGYNPVMHQSQRQPSREGLSVQLQIPFDRPEGQRQIPPPEVQVDVRTEAKREERRRAFDSGHAWSLQKPREQDRWEYLAGPGPGAAKPDLLLIVDYAPAHTCLPEEAQCHTHLKAATSM